MLSTLLRVSLIAVALALLVSPTLAATTNQTAIVAPKQNAAQIQQTTAAAQAPAPAPAAGGGEPVEEIYYQLHAWLMWLGFGVFMPLGIIVARHFQTVTTAWFYIHITLQSLAILCIVPAFWIAIALFDALADSLHAKLGLAVVILAFMQPVLGLIRPHKGTSVRRFWYLFHWCIGTTSVLLSWVVIFKGIPLYEGDWSRDLSAYEDWFAVSIGVLSFVYLLLGRWDYMMGQADPDSKVDGVKRLMGEAKREEQV